jgi:hypothetical protein
MDKIINFKNKIMTIAMRLFSPPEKYIRWYLNKNHGKVELDNGTWAINQSKEFYEYCYGEIYKRWIENNTKQK